jgi:hypothetical protein
VVAVGRVTPEFRNPNGGTEGVGAMGGFSIYCGEDGEFLTYPRILLTNDALVDPRIIYHEFQHARQQTTSEERIGVFMDRKGYFARPVEWKANQAEADYLKEFGMLY